MITYSASGIKSHVKQFVFPGGEVGIKLQQPIYDQSFVKITAHMQDSEDVMALLLVVDAIRRQARNTRLTLSMPYIPYARQDRVCDEGEALSMAVFAQLINSCNFDEVIVLDPHSDVSVALLNNVRVIQQVEVFKSIKQYWGNTIIVAPDAGAYKKSHKFAQEVGAKGVVSCNKVREMSTGNILGMELMGEIDLQSNYLVLDDICDGGRTFIEVASLFTGSGVKLELAVTHGIFSKGLDVVASCYDHVYTTTSFYGNVPEEHERITWKEI